MASPKTFTINEADLEKLAGAILETFCPDGMRNRGGRYTRVDDLDVFNRRATQWLKETLTEITKQNS